MIRGLTKKPYFRLTDPNRDSYGDCNCNCNAFGHAYGYGETYTNPEDRSHAKSSAHARTAPVGASSFRGRL